jgi:hypothetical protein
VRAPDSKIKSDNATLGSDSAQYMTAERWHKVELLFNSLGIDANTVMVDIGPYWQMLGYLKPKQSLREELEELNRQYLKIPNKLMLLTPLQVAAPFRETLAKAEALLAELNKPPSLSEFHRYLVPAGAAKKAVTEYADVLRLFITLCEEQGSSSRQNASKKRRNDCWRDLAVLWQKITINTKKKPLQRHRFKFISICAPAEFTPRSEGEVKEVMKRSAPKRAREKALFRPAKHIRTKKPRVPRSAFGSNEVDF